MIKICQRCENNINENATLCDDCIKELSSMSLQCNKCNKIMNIINETSDDDGACFIFYECAICKNTIKQCILPGLKIKENKNDKDNI